MADSVISKQELIDAQKDAQTLEDAVNGEPGKLIKSRTGREFYSLASVPEINTMTREEVTAAVAPKANKSDVDVALSNLSTTANKYYSTLAAATADIANIALNQSVMVGEEANSGLWEKKTVGATSLTKSPYDPLTQAKKYVDGTVEHVQRDSILELVDVNSHLVMSVDDLGRLHLIGMDADVAESVNKLSNAIDSSTTSNIFEVFDSSGNITLYQNADGDLILPNIGNLTSAIDAKPVIDVGTEGLNIENAYLSGKYADYVLAENMEDFATTEYLLKASDVDALGLFTHPVNLLRIPAITRIGKSKFLLFFEARKEISDLGNISQGVATIDVDVNLGTSTVSNIQSIADSFIDEQGKLRTFMNACGVKLDTGRIICLYVRRYETLEHELFKIHSDDNGVTWSAPEDISSIRADTGWNLICPCSMGIVKRYGKHKGRVVFPVWTSGAGYSNDRFRAGFIYSDDNGDTFNLGTFADYATANEVQCAEDLNGDMLFAIRMENRSPPKIIARYSDATDTYELIDINKSLTADAIMSGLIQGENIYDKSANKFMLSVCKNLNRTELQIHTSYDGGKNWRTHLLPSTIGLTSAYSCIENLTASRKFLVWEADSTINLKYSVIALSNLINEVN